MFTLLLQEVTMTTNTWESFHQTTIQSTILHLHHRFNIQFIHNLIRMVNQKETPSLSSSILIWIFKFADYTMEDYYASNHPNAASSTVNYNNNVITNKNNLNLMVSSNEEIRVPVVRVVKRRTTANKKERRRTQSINSAYFNLRDRIPNVPVDTKLSKVRFSDVISCCIF